MRALEKERSVSQKRKNRVNRLQGVQYVLTSCWCGEIYSGIRSIDEIRRLVADQILEIMHIYKLETDADGVATLTEVDSADLDQL